MSEDHFEMSEEEIRWGAICHAAAYAGFLIPLGNVFGPLIVYRMKKEEFRFVKWEGREALNFQITISILYLIALALCFFIIGIGILIGLFVLNLVLITLATIQAGRGKTFHYPFKIRFV